MRYLKMFMHDFYRRDLETRRPTDSLSEIKSPRVSGALDSSGASKLNLMKNFTLIFLNPHQRSRIREIPSVTSKSAFINTFATTKIYYSSDQPLRCCFSNSF